MRWEQLFADLDSRFEELADAELMAELADRVRVAAGSITLAARLAGAVGRPIGIATVAGVTVSGQLRSAGPDWALLAEAPGREVLVALRQAIRVDGLTTSTGPAPAGLALRLDLRHMLRGITRDRAPVALVVPGSNAAEHGTGTEFTGTIDRVGADFVELALHAPWEPRRPTSVRAVVAVPLSALVLVRALPLG